MNNICVLMSTYNGGKFLREQINSILNQVNANITLLIRDDGSSDNTLGILKEYEEQNKLTFYSGKNMGPAMSFIDLLFSAPEAEYYAFADQDDFHHPQEYHNSHHCAYNTISSQIFHIFHSILQGE